MNNFVIKRISILQNHPFFLTRQYCFLDDYKTNAEKLISLLYKGNYISNEKKAEYLMIIHNMPYNNSINTFNAFMREIKNQY